MMGSDTKQNGVPTTPPQVSTALSDIMPTPINDLLHQ